jgi:hypothetical protein
MAILPKAIYMFNAIPIKIPITFTTEIEKSTLKFIWKHKRLWIAKVILSKKEQWWRYHNTWVQIILQNHSNENSTYWHKNRYEDQWNSLEDPDTNPYSYAHLIFDKEPKIYDGKDSLFDKCCWEKWLSAYRKLKLDPSLSPCTSINSKWIKDLNIRSAILQLIYEKTGNTLETIGIGKDFLSRTQAVQQLR